MSGPAVAKWVEQKQYVVFSVYDEARGLDDERIIEKAYQESYIIITNDKDFGELIVRQKKPQKGVILLRLEDEKAKNKIKVVKKLLETYADKVAGNFLVVTEKIVKIIGKGEQLK